MPNDEARNNVSILAQLFVIPVSSLVRHSTFVLRHFGELTCASRPLILFASARGARFQRFLIVPSCSRLQEKAVKAAKVRPERPAIYHRNKFESCIRDIFAFRHLEWELCLCLFARAGRSLPSQKAMTPATRLLFSGEDN
jgi:hypothetical protein